MTTATNEQESLFSADMKSPVELVKGVKPFYETRTGIVFHADALEVLKKIPDSSVNLVFTSPPYALHFKKEYGNVSQGDYVAWFMEFAKEIKRILTDDGSFVLNIGGTWQKGQPTRSIYHFKLVAALVEELGLHLAQETFWYNPAKMPAPAEWVTVRRIRVKDAVEYVWWFSKTPWPKADNRKVLRPYSKDMLRLNAKGVKSTTRPSGHNINESWDKIHSGGSIPPNMIEDEIPVDMFKMGNNSSNDGYTKKCKAAGMKIHPARFPAQLPEFFIKMLTDEGDTVVDPFGGSMTTGFVADGLNRKWIGIDNVEEYLEASKFRFE
ncbi:DNA-methyltransferase [Variovorax sp. PvP013]|uniref:DNA-methyltransferase n=1 Tax=Variovorax sp. PvP013 TaxID=3156435 RepID=UPI003D208C56